MSVNDQPATPVSVTVFTPKPAPETVNDVSLSSVASASSSSSNGPNEPVNAKFCASLGTASLTIVTVASFLFVNVHVMSSPGSTCNVAVAPWSDPSEHVMSVNDQPATPVSVTVFTPKPAPETVNDVSLSSVASASSSSSNGPNEPVNAKFCA